MNKIAAYKEAIYKEAKKQQIKEDKNNTNFMRDRIVPNVKSKALGAAGFVGGAAVGAGAGAAKSELIAKGIKFGKNKLLEKQKPLGEKILANKNFQEADRILFNNPNSKKIRMTIGGIGGAAYLAPKAGKLVENMSNAHRLKKLYKKNFNIEPTEDEYVKTTGLTKKQMDKNPYLRHLFNTPESIVQSRKRQLKWDNDYNYRNFIKNQE